MEKIWNDVVTFFGKGNNLYYAIGLLIIIILVIVIAVSVKNKKKKTLNTQDTSQVALHEQTKKQDHNTGVKEQEAKQEVLASTAKAYDSDKLGTASDTTKDSQTKLTKIVEVTPVVHKPKPQVVPEKSAVLPKVDTPISAEEDEEIRLKRPGVVQIYKDNGGKFRFRFKASNNETVGHSQGYTAKAACRNGIKAVQRAVETAETIDTIKDTDYKVTIGVPVFEIYKDNEDKFRFRLRAANANNILASQGYTTKENCINGIRSIKHLANNHKIVDETLKK